MKTRPTTLVGLFALVLGSLALTACGSDNNSNTTGGGGRATGAGGSTGGGGSTSAGGGSGVGGDTATDGGSGGSTGGGGAGVAPADPTLTQQCATQPAFAAKTMLDDFEGSDPTTPWVWYVAQDTHVEVVTGASPSPEPLALWGSYAAASTAGLRFTTKLIDPNATVLADPARYGANLDFEGPTPTDGGVKDKFDLTTGGATGIQFWARRAGAPGNGWKSVIRVAVALPTLLPADQGGDGTCVDQNNDSGVGGTCYSLPQKDITLTDTCWKLVQIPFTGFKQTWGKAPPGGMNYAEALGIELQFSDYDAGSITKFLPTDVLIDDLSTY